MRIADLEAFDDDQLVRAFVEGSDADALTVLLRRHETQVYGLAYRILGNRSDAYDATQDVFLTVFRKVASFRHESSFSTWIYRLTSNACNDMGRKLKRVPIPVEEVEPEVDAAADEHSFATEDRLMIEGALTELPIDQRTAVVMRDIYGLTYEQISAATGAPEGTVKSRIARGRLALAERLREPGHPRRRLTEKEL